MVRTILFVKSGVGGQPVPATELSEAGFTTEVVYAHGSQLPPKPEYRPDLAVWQGGVMLTAPVVAWAAPVPLIVVSDVAEDVDRIIGLELGADDVVAAPYNPRELIARIRNIVGTEGQAEAPDHARTTSFFDWTLDNPTRLLSHRDGDRLRLSPSEYRVLRLLLDSDGRTLSRQDIQRLTSQEDGSPIPLRGIDVIVNRLRIKLFGGSAFDILQTIHGQGYRMRLLWQIG